eukprot:54333-Eustigmatos_ZCMA.PRE.3
MNISQISSGVHKGSHKQGLCASYSRHDASSTRPIRPACSSTARARCSSGRDPRRAEVLGSLDLRLCYPQGHPLQSVHGREGLHRPALCHAPLRISGELRPAVRAVNPEASTSVSSSAAYSRDTLPAIVAHGRQHQVLIGVEGQRASAVSIFHAHAMLAMTLIEASSDAMAYS